VRRSWFAATAALASLIASLAGPRRAAASPPEVFGFGSRQAGLGGAVAARVDDFSSGYYNPAGLAFGTGKRVTLGLFGAASNLHVNDRTVGIAEPFGIVFGATAPAPLGGPLAGRVRVGIGLYLLPTTIVRVIARLPDEPFYPWYDNRTQRLVVLPFAAFRITDRLGVGVAANVLAGLAGHVVAGEGPTRALEARVDEEVPTRATINAGVRFRALPTWDVALVYRQEFGVPFTTVADTTVAGEPIDLSIAAKGLFTPDTVVLGNALRTPVADLSLDVHWARWSAYPGPFVVVDSNLPLVGPLSGVLPAVPWKDTFGAKLGVERVLPGDQVDVALRAGYGFETSPVPASQPGVTNLLDGNKHTVSLGLGLDFHLPGSKKRVRVDVHVQAQLVQSRTMRKTVAPAGETPAPFDALRDEVTDDQGDPSTLGTQISNPGYPSIRSGGEVFSGGLTVEMGL
jgi:long-chain fatty acid transport protein